MLALRWVFGLPALGSTCPLCDRPFSCGGFSVPRLMLNLPEVILEEPQNWLWWLHGTCVLCYRAYKPHNIQTDRERRWDRERRRETGREEEGERKELSSVTEHPSLWTVGWEKERRKEKGSKGERRIVPSDRTHKPLNSSLREGEKRKDGERTALSWVTEHTSLSTVGW